ncbi:aldehyde dehydrogenase [Marichromatium bheemlicum]|uniref:Aldehyde dehydrogenase n=1 Tax=Marichromatium bheemlicum TaxID=365339 RepID=A0ABX1I5Z0_9GAMM|nr:aldehyde dehydrogenase [Marichromatium bheemlicum]NKN32474.1 aldehyde dehydrogenase [Marichromatium bheemlicum]
MYQTQLLIGAEWRPGSTARCFEWRGPLATTAVTTRAAAADHSDAKAAIEAAAVALPDWAGSPPARRRALLQEAATRLARRRTDFIARICDETGASTTWAELNIEQACAILHEAAALTTAIQGSLIPSNLPGNIACAVRRPAGVVLGIAPWNAPLILGARAIATPLACGNTLVFKGAERCPATHALLVETLCAAGLPAGVLNLISHAPEDAAALTETMIAHPAVRRVNFTGSTRVGRAIAHSCAEHLKPAILELGGKAVLIVLDDADLEAAARAARFGAFVNSGQVCMSTERLIVDTAVADAFTERLAAQVRALTAGDPRHGNAPLGAVIEPATLERANALIEDALAQGARLVVGEPDQTLLMRPVLLDGLTPEMRLYHEESFAPIAAIMRVPDTETAIARANDNTYGLAAAVFGRDLARTWQVAERIESGICHINGPTVHDEPQMPFGGLKASGYGRFGGQAGIDAFTELRWISLQTTPRQLPC